MKCGFLLVFLLLEAHTYSLYYFVVLMSSVLLNMGKKKKLF